nr:discoidin domain-containing protein [Tessaracoccus sp. OS52]
MPAHAADFDIFASDPHLPEGLVNLAEGKRATSSSAYEKADEGWATSFVNDGRIGTGALAYGWSTNPIGNTATVTTPAWTQLDLIAPSTIESVAVWPRMDAAAIGQNFPVDYAVEVSGDGRAWTTAATSTGNSSVTSAQVLEFEPVDGRFIRIHATRRAPGGADGPLVQVAEFAVYGTAQGSLLEVDKPALELLPGESDRLTALVNGTPADPSGLTWKSADPSVATVDATGLVQAVALGSTTILATLEGSDPVAVPVEVIAERVHTDSEFMISAFWPPTAQYTTAEQYDLLADAHVDYVQNVDSTDLQGRSLNLEMAALAAERGMRVGISDPRLNESLGLSDAEIREIVASYENVPGVGGFYLKDEPFNANPYARVHRAVKDEAPWLYPYLNFLPMFAYPDRATYESQMDDFVELAGTDEVDYLMYDHYPFGDAPNSLNYRSMLENMGAVRTVGLENDVKTGLYLQSIGRVNADGSPAGFRRPNAAEIRYEVNAALAHGFKQISYFTWFTPTGRPETFTDAIIAPDGTPTDLYGPVKQVNAEVKALGPTLMGLDAVEVYLAGPDTYGQPTIPDGFIGQVGEDDNVIISRMVNEETGRQYLMVVNNDFTAAQSVDLHVLRGVKQLQVVSRIDGALETRQSRNGQFRFELDRGDAVLLALPAGVNYAETPGAEDPVNLALNADVTAPTSEGAGGWYMDKLTDGVRFSTAGSRGWRATEAAEGELSTVTLDLREARSLNRIDLYPTGSVFGFGQGFPGSVTVSASSDGHSWTELATADLDIAPGAPVPSLTFADTKARHLRFEFADLDRMGSEPALQLGEIEVFSDDGTLPPPASIDPGVDDEPWFEGKNLAQGRPVEASSSTEAPQWGWSTAFVVDGQSGPTAGTNGWTSQVAVNWNENEQEWVAVYLGGPYLLDQVVAHPRNAATDQANAGLGFPTDYRVETSLDGRTWEVAAEVTGDVAISAEPRVLALDQPVAAAYVRLVGTRLKLSQHAADGYLMQIGELQAYGTPA